MKLKMTLSERPGLLHALPVVNLVALLWLLLLLGPAMVQSSGVTVELPPSSFQLERFQNHVVVTLGPGENAACIHLGRDQVSTDELVARLDQLRADGGETRTMVILQSDAGTPVGLERQIAELILGKRFRLAIAGTNLPTSPSTEISNDSD